MLFTWTIPHEIPLVLPYILQWAVEDSTVSVHNGTVPNYSRVRSWHVDAYCLDGSMNNGRARGKEGRHSTVHLVMCLPWVALFAMAFIAGLDSC